MSATSYYWQGGRRIEIEQEDNVATVEAADVDEVQAAADRAGVDVTVARQLSPGIVRVEFAKDRDQAMDDLRKSHVVHHAYCTKGQPDDEIIITDSFFVKFKDDTPKRDIERVLEDESLEIVDDFGKNSLLVRVTDATGKNPIRAANSVALREIVEYAEPNLVRNLVRCGFIPADPLFPSQWHLFAPVNDTELVKGAGINAPDAWELTTGRRDVVVAVADDGFDLTHPDFAGTGKVVGRLNVTPTFSGLRYDSDVSPRPGDYHGTPCAGVAIAEQNGQGVVGVAPGCAFLAVRFPLTTDDGQLARMFIRISRDADVVSCSWGYPPTDRPMSLTLRDEITRLARTGGRRGKGLVFCVAAGNNNAPVKDLNNTETYEYFDNSGRLRRYSGPIDRWIAAHPDVITVSACTSLKTRSSGATQ